MKSSILILSLGLLLSAIPTYSFAESTTNTHKTASDFCSSISAKGSEINQRISSEKDSQKNRRKLPVVTTQSKDGSSTAPTSQANTRLEKLAGTDPVKLAAISSFQAAVKASQNQYKTDNSTALTTYQASLATHKAVFQPSFDAAMSQRTTSLNSDIATAKQSCALAKPSTQVREDFLNATKLDATTFRLSTTKATNTLNTSRQKDLLQFRHSHEIAASRLKIALAAARVKLSQALGLVTSSATK